jgi:hypothetical protein
MYQTSVYHAMRSSTAQTMDALRARLDTLPESVRREAEAVLASEDNIIARFQPLRSIKFSGWRIRPRDYHQRVRENFGVDLKEVRRPSEQQLKRSPPRAVHGHSLVRRPSDAGHADKPSSLWSGGQVLVRLGDPSSSHLPEYGQTGVTAAGQPAGTGHPSQCVPAGQGGL